MSWVEDLLERKAAKTVRAPVATDLWTFAGTGRNPGASADSARLAALRGLAITGRAGAGAAGFGDGGVEVTVVDEIPLDVIGDAVLQRVKRVTEAGLGQSLGARAGVILVLRLQGVRHVDELDVRRLA